MYVGASALSSISTQQQADAKRVQKLTLAAMIALRLGEWVLWAKGRIERS
jgi:hypothetical protein